MPSDISFHTLSHTLPCTHALIKISNTKPHSPPDVPHTQHAPLTHRQKHVVCSVIHRRRHAALVAFCHCSLAPSTLISTTTNRNAFIAAVADVAVQEGLWGVGCVHGMPYHPAHLHSENKEQRAQLTSCARDLTLCRGLCQIVNLTLCKRLDVVQGPVSDRKLDVVQET
jgi:hypothetical protein